MKNETLFKISSYIAAKTGRYIYGTCSDGAGVFVSSGMAKNFALQKGDLPEWEFSEFMCTSVGGVNGKELRAGEELLFLRHDGEYSLISCTPDGAGKFGYLRETKIKPPRLSMPFSELPNFERIREIASRRAGDAFFVISVTPRENFGERYDYACIAEFFDRLREKASKPSVFWIGGKNYIVILKPEQKGILAELGNAEIKVNGKSVRFLVTRASISPEYTNFDQIQKLAFCADKLSNGVSGDEYEFNEEEFFEYRNSLGKGSLESDFESMELEFSPVISVKTGRVKYFYAEPKDKTLAERAASCREEKLFNATLCKKLSNMIAHGDAPKAQYCLRMCSNFLPKDELCALSEQTESKILIETRARVARFETELARRVKMLKKQGIGAVLFAPKAEKEELDGIRRAGFEIIRLDTKDSEALRACADYCRMFLLDCAVHDVDSEEEFRALRRLGVDLCQGKVFAPSEENPWKTLYPEPVVLHGGEPEKEDFDIKRFAAEKIWALCEKAATDRIDSDLEPAERLEKLDHADYEMPLEYEEGLGAKKVRRSAGSEASKKRRQKKEIKKAKLKKLKKQKKGKGKQ